MPWIDAVLVEMVRLRSSDLHLCSGNRPMVRVDGDMTAIDGTVELEAAQVEAILQEITPKHLWEEFRAENDADFAYALEGVGRFRANLFADHKGPGGVFRVIPDKIPTAQELGLPPAALAACEHSRGLVLVTGPTGSGKSTTLASMIHHINASRAEHIITIEDPIEFVHPNLRCLVNQREVGRHTASFKRALKAALREDPDIVLVGELRDLETIAIAIETAETGHLVFGTLHTNTAPATVNRIIDQFPAGQQAQIRMMLAGSLRAVISQTLCKRVGGGRVAAHEILVCNTGVASLIRDGKSHQILSAMQVGGREGMRLLVDALFELVRAGSISVDEAVAKSPNKDEMRTKLAEAGYRVEGAEAAAPPSAGRPGAERAGMARAGR